MKIDQDQLFVTEIIQEDLSKISLGKMLHKKEIVINKIHRINWLID